MADKPRTDTKGAAPEKGGDRMDKLTEAGKPLADAVENLLGDAGGGAPAGEGGAAPSPVEGEPGAAGDVAPLVEKLDVTPEHAQELLDAAMASEQYSSMSPDELADLLAGDPQALADLERRVEEARGAPEPGPEEVEMQPGDVTDTGTALWAGAPEVGQKGKLPMPPTEGRAPWPRG